MHQAANALFGEDVNKTPEINGKTLEVRPCKVRHVGLILDLFNAILTRMDRKQMTDLVTLIGQYQERVIAKGGKPSDILVQDIVDDKGNETSIEQRTQSLVSQAFGGATLTLSLFHACIDVLPDCIGALTNITAEEFEDLDPFDGIKVATAVFAMNYAFFTRNLPPQFQGFVAQVAGKLRNTQ